MLIARDKKKNNIAEYILYMWQLEDMLRALGLDMEHVNKCIIAKYDVGEELTGEIYAWYDNLTEMMRKEKIEKSGHLQVVKNNVDELTELHYYLLHKENDYRYRQLVTLSAANLVDFRAKSALPEEISDVELALNGLYGYLMLKLQKKEISASTVQAMESFGKMMAYLSAKYNVCLT